MQRGWCRITDHMPPGQTAPQSARRTHATARIVYLLVPTVLLLMAIAGGSFGQLATRLRVVRVDSGRPLSLLVALMRQVLICLVVPPLVFRPDGRGLHDLAARSATVPLRVPGLDRPTRG